MDKINTRHRTPLDQVNFWFVIMIMQNENKEQRAGFVSFISVHCLSYEMKCCPSLPQFSWNRISVSITMTGTRASIPTEIEKVPKKKKKYL